ncbi:unnamed protein product, partial [Bubo scandiacus]
SSSTGAAASQPPAGPVPDSLPGGRRPLSPVKSAGLSSPRDVSKPFPSTPISHLG